MNELEDNREFKEAAAAAAAKAAADLENESFSVRKGDEAEVEARKMSIDSGVASVGEASDGNESDKSSGVEEKATVPEKEAEAVVNQTNQTNPSAPNSPSGSYNLRERRGVNFAMYR